MNWKNFLVAVSLAITLPTSADARGELWYDANSHLPQFKKLVVYPVRGLNGNFLIDENEKSEVFQVNDYFNKRFVRKLKIETVPLGSSLAENKELRVDAEKYKSLYNNFSSEKERALTVADVTGANGYIIPKINLDETEPHISPAKTVKVEMKSYTKEEDGPNGDRTYDEKKWTENHTIPQYDLMLYHMGIEYNMFDREGKKIMTYRNAEHTYGDEYGGAIGLLQGVFGGKRTRSLKPERYRVEMFKSIVDEFRKDFKDIQSNFKKNKKKERSKKVIGFRNINLPSNAGGDEYALKAIYFTMKDLAFKYTDLEVDYDNSGNAQYFVQGNISSYYFGRHWVEPSATTYEAVESEEKSDWYDSQGNKHTKKIKKYVTKITDHHGYWKYNATVSGNFQLVDANGRVVVNYSDEKNNDKVSDAYYNLLKDFYGKVNDLLGEKKKK